MFDFSDQFVFLQLNPETLSSYAVTVAFLQIVDTITTSTCSEFPLYNKDSQ